LFISNIFMLRRPIIRIPFTKTAIYFEMIILMVLIVFWIMVSYVHKLSPEIIQPQVPGDGNVNSYGNKNRPYKLPSIATILYIIMTVYSFFPHIFNYLTEITVENAERQYAIAVRNLRVLKFIVVLT